MKIAVLADIHSNLTAFEAVLEDIEQRGGVGEVWCAGDIIGYGPDPRECIETARKTCSLCVAGNHDLAAAGVIDTSDFNPYAAAANRWTAQQLTHSEVEFIKGLPLTVERGDFTIAHGSPREPVYEYILDAATAMGNLEAFSTRYCVVGHTHAPALFAFGKSRPVKTQGLGDGDDIKLGSERLIINPGGVGQPRDGDPRASYGLIDTDRRIFTLHRVPYDIPSVRSRMEKAGLPEVLWRRLGVGR